MQLLQATALFSSLKPCRTAIRQGFILTIIFCIFEILKMLTLSY